MSSRRWMRSWAGGLAAGMLATAHGAPAGAGTNAVAAAATGAAGRATAPATALAASLTELAALRAEIADAKVPLAAELARHEQTLLDARAAHEAVRRQLDGRSLDLNNIRNEIKTRETEKAYLANLLGEYVRNLETRLHIAELARYQAVIETARLAPENGNLKPAEAFAAQIAATTASLDRLDELAGGARYEGRAAGPDGIVLPGTFVLLGPVAYFAAREGALAGVVEQRLGSLEPAVLPYADPACAAATRALVETGRGCMPFDSSLGNARKVEELSETLVEHILRGGAVMYPILGIAGLAALVAAFKWLALTFTRLPGKRKLNRLLAAVATGDAAAVQAAAKGIRGHAGRMLRAGAAHYHGPKELIEELMFEQMLRTRHELQRALPFIAVTAACAPLLGLLGTVTGIITTFKLITVFGSGDIKMLSAGISEALITTEYGLYVAIPSVLIHAFLSRKAKGLQDRLERIAIAFLGAIEKRRAAGTTAAGATAAAPSAPAAPAAEPPAPAGPVVALAAAGGTA